jgi:DNA-binding NtrC family response regulator
MPSDDTRSLSLDAVSLANLKILIAEDENMLAWELEELLREFGDPRIFCSPSLRGARETLAAHPDIALVLLDLKLQDGSGEELIVELTAKGIPLIVVTGYSPSESYGVPTLTKPYATAALVGALNSALPPASLARRKFSP